MRFKTLDEWLDWQTALHPRQIELGLHRCKMVAERLKVLTPNFTVITVGGTNGKGSSVMMLDAFLQAGGYRTGRYMSPHLLRYNERICINGLEVSDTVLCDAFNAIEDVRKDISLTFFEFSTLAALYVFQQAGLDVVILEVGLGGRLDAVNIIDSDVALVTAIDIDHVDWLGSDRESIGFEKAGIFRANRPAVCSDPNPPQRLIDYAQQLQTPLYRLNHDYHYQKTTEQTWYWQYKAINYPLPMPALKGDFQLQNAAGVLMVLTLLQARHPLGLAQYQQGLATVRNAGRFQVIHTQGECTRILDVAHNLQAAQVLKQLLQHYPAQGKRYAVVSILKDKDIEGIMRCMLSEVDEWHIAPLHAPRATPIEELQAHLQAIGATHIHCYQTISDAYQTTLQQASALDRVIVFGSFYTVAEALTIEQNRESFQGK
ncbi:folylpolyglutamate synthase/dihydrofolate synthase [Beggiatoa alba B18LD]|uniref:Dihydrofolate synthase/folylpolyglutamate synthase n=1 Tax=Beggiatoa alba B18LD TaxID=395493 RepID=I3CD43_9GAMM|nr:bifunctional tetrahydrofolate synthase/dihydrofolate synthase [Beggiatoa alba]EIJ41536.1 folylpolyglutamate synthase/dihydrofolate synthase [Beggiatoa alba B18LD]